VVCMCAMWVVGMYVCVLGRAVEWPHKFPLFHFAFFRLLKLHSHTQAYTERTRTNPYGFCCSCCCFFFSSLFFFNCLWPSTVARWFLILSTPLLSSPHHLLHFSFLCFIFRRSAIFVVFTFTHSCTPTHSHSHRGDSHSHTDTFSCRISWLSHCTFESPNFRSEHLKM